MMASLGMEAKSMKDLLVSMPDSVVPYLNHNLRLEFTELQEMGVKAEVKNLLGETSVMDTLRMTMITIMMMTKRREEADSLRIGTSWLPASLIR
jgi:hypothetical protein